MEFADEIRLKLEAKIKRETSIDSFDDDLKAPESLLEEIQY